MGLTDIPLNNEAFCVEFVEKNIYCLVELSFVCRATCNTDPPELPYNILNVDINFKGLILLPFTQ